MHEFELLTRVLSDPLPQLKVDGLYLFCQTSHNEASVLASGVALYHLGIVNKLFIMDCPEMNGFPGVESWSTHVNNHGVDTGAIEKINNVEKGNLHTLIEAQSLVNHAIKNNYKHIILMSSGFHQIRAFLTAVTAMKQANVSISFYSQPGKPLDWNQTVSHSQGKLTKIRKELIYTELERMHSYQEKGDLLHFKDGVDYLDNRKYLASS